MTYITLLSFILFMIGLIIFIQLNTKNEHDENFIDLRKVKKGDNIVLISGLHGIVDAIDDNKNIVTIDCDGVYFDYDMYAIKEVLSQEELSGA